MDVCSNRKVVCAVAVVTLTAGVVSAQEQWTWDPQPFGNGEISWCDPWLWDIEPWAGPYDRVVLAPPDPNVVITGSVVGTWTCGPTPAEIVTPPGMGWGLIEDGAGIAMHGDLIQNDGGISIVADHGSLAFNDAESNVVNPRIVGSGEISLRGAVVQRISQPMLKTLFHGPGHTIHGSCEFYGRNTINAGTMGAVWSMGSPAGQFNPFDFIGSTVDQTETGVIMAEGNSELESPGLVRLRSYTDVPCIIRGGTLRTNDVGTIIVEDPSVFETLIIDGQVLISGSDGKTLTCVGDMTNNGDVHLNGSGGSGVALEIMGPATWAGTGTISMEGSISSIVSADPNNDTLINSAGHTISGNGQVNIALDNRGTVSADRASQVLRLPHPVLNNSATVQATGGGDLSIETTVVQSPTGRVGADGANSQAIVRSGAKVVGGTIGGSNGGVVLLEDGGTIEDVSIDGDVLVNSGITATTHGDVHNTGSVSVAASTSPPALRFDGSATWSGTGEILLSRVFNSRADLTYGDPTDVLTNAADHTIRGEGRISVGLNNLGTVSADGTLELTLREQDSTNSGTIEAVGAAQLVADGVTIDQTGGGELIGRDDSLIQLHNGAAVIGGTLGTQDNGLLEVNGAGTLLENTDLTGRVELRLGEFLELRGTITNNARFVVGSRGPDGVSNRIVRNAPLTVNGSGRIVLNAFGNPGTLPFTSHLAYGTLASDIFTNGEDHRIEGHGGLMGHFVNEGILAPGSDYEFINDDTRRLVLVDGGVTCTESSRVEIQFEGTSEAAGDRILGQAGTTFHCDGDLIIENINGFGGPLEGQTFDIIVAPGGLTGEFDTVTLLGAADYAVEYLPDRVRLTGTCAGNIDGSSDVNLTDLATVLSQFGMTGEELAGDVDGDGDVDFDDVSRLLSNFGAGCG